MKFTFEFRFQYLFEFNQAMNLRPTHNNLYSIKRSLIKNQDYNRHMDIPVMII